MNLLYYPVENMMVGGENLWGDRENKNGDSNDNNRVQISMKFNFGTTLSVNENLGHLLRSSQNPDSCRP